jgi:hypothetical protein
VRPRFRRSPAGRGTRTRRTFGAASTSSTRTALLTAGRRPGATSLALLATSAWVLWNAGTPNGHYKMNDERAAALESVRGWKWSGPSGMAEERLTKRAKTGS